MPDPAEMVASAKAVAVDVELPVRAQAAELVEQVALAARP
jgi:hypothetical protein